MNSSWKDVKQNLKDLIEADQISDHEAIRKAGLSRSTYYQLFDPDRVESPMHKSTVFALAKVLNHHVKYVDGIPQFTQMLARPSRISAKHVHESIDKAVEITGSLAKFSRLSGMDIDQLNTLMDLSPNTIIDISSLDLIDSAIDRLDLKRISKGPMKSPEVNIGKVDENIISDNGLLQLLTGENLTKHNISESERSELLMISQNRNTQTTIEHWVSILYTLRALDN
jgi:hypothetical protein